MALLKEHRLDSGVTVGFWRILTQTPHHPPGRPMINEIVLGGWVDATAYTNGASQVETHEFRATEEMYGGDREPTREKTYAVLKDYDPFFADASDALDAEAPTPPPEPEPLPRHDADFRAPDPDPEGRKT